MTKAEGLTTVIIGPPDGRFPNRVVRIGQVSWDNVPGFAAPLTIEIVEGREGESRMVHAATLEQVAPGIWQGTRFFDEDDEVTTDHVAPILIRPTEPDDAVLLFSGIGLGFPMPVPVMDYLINVEFGPVKLFALTEDDGYVATMMLDSEPGIYIRYSGAWHQIVDTDVIDGLSVHEVDDSALDMFDQYDRAGQLVPVTAMPLNGIPVEAPSVRAPTNPVPVTDNGVGAVTAGVGARTKEVPRIDSVEDIEKAIAAAAKNPEIRWYVERRCKALGASGVKFPW